MGSSIRNKTRPTSNNAFVMDFAHELNDLVAIKIVMETVEGFLKFDEGYYLYSLAKRSKLPIVEIGSYKGKSTICLALGSKAGNRCKVYAIDHHRGSPEFYNSGIFGKQEIWSYDDFIQNLKNFKILDVVEPVLSTSEDAIANWIKTIGLLWVDGSHYYEYVKRDFLLWEPYVAAGGVIAFHDSHWDGPKRVIKEFFVKPKFVDLNFVNSIACVTKAMV